MAKKSDFGGFKFNDPRIQAAYNDMFSQPVEAPIVIEYDGKEVKTQAQKDFEKEAKARLHRNPVMGVDTTSIRAVERGAPEKLARSASFHAHVRKVHADIARAQKKAAKEREKAAKAGTLKGALGAKGNKDLAQSVYNSNQAIEALGGNKVGQAKKGNSFWGRTFDILSRGNYAAAEGISRAVKASKDKDGTNPLEQITEFGKGALAGVEGKKKTTFSKVLKEQGVKNKYVTGIGGLGLDIALDPTTYMGLGLVGKAGQAVKAGEKVIQHLDETEKVIQKSRGSFALPKEAKDLLSRQHYIEGRVSQGAAKSEHSQQIIEIIDKTAVDYKNARVSQLKTELADNFIEPGLTGKALKDAKKALNQESRDRAATEAAQWQAETLRMSQDVAATRIKKGLGINVGGVKGTTVAIPLGRLPVAAVEKIAKIDPIAKGLKTFETKFKASAGVIPELHNARLATLGRGFARAHYLGGQLRNASKGVPKEDREMAWELALDGTPNSGVMFKEADSAGNVVDVDAAAMMHRRVQALTDRVTGGATGDPPYKAKELNAVLPVGFKGNFNSKLGDDWVRESMKQWELKDGPAALWTAEQAFERAASKRALLSSTADSFGVRIAGNGAIKDAGHITKNLQDQGYRELKASTHHGLLDGVIFDEETASGMEKILGAMENEREWNKTLRKFASVTNPIKFMLTMPNPGFHFRNAMGDFFINQLDNVSVNSYHHAGKVLAKQEAKYGGVSPLIMKQGDILENANKMSKQTVLFHTRFPLKRARGAPRTAVTESEIFAGLNKYGIRQNYALNEFDTLADVNPAHIGTNALREGKLKLTAASEMREDYFRTAHFIELVKSNPSKSKTLDENMAWAAARIRKTHFDYSDFTKFEKQTMSTLIPFYKWTRKALPLMTEILFTQPGKAIIPNKAQTAVSELLGNPDPRSDDPLPNLAGVVPKWMIDMGYTPGTNFNLGGHNNETMFGIPSPFSDMATQTIQPALEGHGAGAVNTVGAMLNPLIKMPAEQLLNRDFFLSTPDKNVKVRQGDYGQAQPKSAKEEVGRYALKQVPYVRQIMRGFEGPADKRNFGSLVSQLTGIYTQEVTPAMQRGELSRQRDVASLRSKKLKRDISNRLVKKGVTPPQTSSEWKDFLKSWAAANGR
jgi:hypothetical protein